MTEEEFRTGQEPEGAAATEEVAEEVLAAPVEKKKKGSFVKKAADKPVDAPKAAPVKSGVFVANRNVKLGGCFYKKGDEIPAELVNDETRQYVG